MLNNINIGKPKPPSLSQFCFSTLLNLNGGIERDIDLLVKLNDICEILSSCQETISYQICNVNKKSYLQSSRLIDGKEIKLFSEDKLIKNSHLSKSLGNLSVKGYCSKTKAFENTNILYDGWCVIELDLQKKDDEIFVDRDYDINEENILKIPTNELEDDLGFINQYKKDYHDIINTSDNNIEPISNVVLFKEILTIIKYVKDLVAKEEAIAIDPLLRSTLKESEIYISDKGLFDVAFLTNVTLKGLKIVIYPKGLIRRHHYSISENNEKSAVGILSGYTLALSLLKSAFPNIVEKLSQFISSKIKYFLLDINGTKNLMLPGHSKPSSLPYYLINNISNTKFSITNTGIITNVGIILLKDFKSWKDWVLSIFKKVETSWSFEIIRRNAINALNDKWKRQIIFKFGEDIYFKNNDRFIDQDMFLSALAYIYLSDNPTMIIQKQEMEKNNTPLEKQTKLNNPLSSAASSNRIMKKRSDKFIYMFEMIRSKESLIKKYVSLIMETQENEHNFIGLIWEENELYNIGIRLYMASQVEKKNIVEALPNKFKLIWDHINGTDKNITGKTNICHFREFCTASVLYEWLYRRRLLFIDQQVPGYKKINSTLKSYLPGKNEEKQWNKRSKILINEENNTSYISMSTVNDDSHIRNNKANIDVHLEKMLYELLNKKHSNDFSESVDKGDCTLAWMITLLAERFCALYNILSYPLDFYEDATRDEEKGGLGLIYRGLSKNDFIEDCFILKNIIKGYIGLIDTNTFSITNKIDGDKINIGTSNSDNKTSSDEVKDIEKKQTNMKILEDGIYLPPHRSIANIGHGGKVACLGCIRKTENAICDTIKEYNKRVLNLKMKAFHFNDIFKDDDNNHESDNDSDDICLDYSNNDLIKKIKLGSNTYQKMRSFFYNTTTNTNTTNSNNNIPHNTEKSINDIKDNNIENDNDDNDSIISNESTSSSIISSCYSNISKNNNNIDETDDKDTHNYHMTDNDIDKGYKSTSSSINNIKEMEQDIPIQDKEETFGFYSPCKMEEFYTLKQFVFSKDVKSAICHRQRFISLGIVDTVNRLFKSSILRDRKKFKCSDRRQLKYINNAHRVFKKYVAPFSFPLNLVDAINGDCSCSKSKRKPILVIPNSKFTNSIIEGMEYNTHYRERAIFHDIAVLLGFTNKNKHNDNNNQVIRNNINELIKDKGLFLIDSLLKNNSIYKYIYDNINIGQLTNPRFLNRLEFDKGSYKNDKNNNYDKIWHRLMTDANREAERTLFSTLFLLVSKSSPHSIENMTMTTVQNKGHGIKSLLTETQSNNEGKEYHNNMFHNLKMCRLFGTIKDIINYFKGVNIGETRLTQAGYVVSVLEHIQHLFKNSLPINMTQIEWGKEIFDMRQGIFNLDEGGVILMLSKFLKCLLETFFGDKLFECSYAVDLEILFKEADINKSIEKGRCVYPIWITELLILYENYLHGNDISILEKFIGGSSLFMTNDVLESLNISSNFSYNCANEHDNNNNIKNTYAKRAEWIIAREAGNPSTSFTYIVLTVVCYRLFFEPDTNIYKIFSRSEKNNKLNASKFGILIECMGLCGNVWEGGRRISHDRVLNAYMATDRFPVNDGSVYDEVYYYRFMAYSLGFYLLSEEKLATISHDIHLKFDANEISTSNWNIFIQRYFNMFILGRRARLLCAPLRYFKRLLSTALSSQDEIMRKIALLLFMKRINGDELTSIDIINCCKTNIKPDSLAYYYSEIRNLNKNSTSNDYEYTFYGNACSNERYNKVKKSMKLIDTCISMMLSNKEPNLINTDYNDDKNIKNNNIQNNNTNKSKNIKKNTTNSNKKNLSKHCRIDKKKDLTINNDKKGHNKENLEGCFTNTQSEYLRGVYGNDDDTPMMTLGDILEAFHNHMTTMQVVDHIKDVINRLKLFFEIENIVRGDIHSKNYTEMEEKDGKEELCYWEKINKAIKNWNKIVYDLANVMHEEYTIERNQFSLYTSCNMSIIRPEDFKDSGKDILNVHGNLILQDLRNGINNKKNNINGDCKFRPKIKAYKKKIKSCVNQKKILNDPYDSDEIAQHKKRKYPSDVSSNNDDNDEKIKLGNEQDHDSNSLNAKRPRLIQRYTQTNENNNKMINRYNEVQKFVTQRVIINLNRINKINMIANGKNCSTLITNASQISCNYTNNINIDINPISYVNTSSVELSLPSVEEEKFAFKINNSVTPKGADEAFVPLECLYKCFEGIHPIDQVYLFKKLLIRPYNKLWVYFNKELIRKFNNWGYIGFDNLTRPYCMLAEQNDPSSNYKYNNTSLKDSKEMEETQGEDEDEDDIDILKDSLLVNRNYNNNNREDDNDNDDDNSNIDYEYLNNTTGSSLTPLSLLSLPNNNDLISHGENEVPGITHSKYLTAAELEAIYMVNHDQYQTNENSKLARFICKREILNTIHKMLTNYHLTKKRKKKNILLSDIFILFYVPNMDIYVNDQTSSINIELKETNKVERNGTIFFDDMEMSMIEGIRMWGIPSNNVPYLIRIGKRSNRVRINCLPSQDSYSSISSLCENSEENDINLGRSMLMTISHAMQLSTPVKSRFKANADAICQKSIPKWLKHLAVKPPLPRHVFGVKDDTILQDFGAVGSMYFNISVNIGHLLVDNDCISKRLGVASAITENIFYIANGICTRTSILSWESIKTVIRNDKKYLCKDDTIFKKVKRKKKRSVLFYIPYVVKKHPSDLFSDYILFSRFSKQKDNLIRSIDGSHPLGWCMFLADPIKYPTRLILRQNHLKCFVDNAGVAAIMRTGVPCRKFNRDLAIKNGDLLSIKMEKSLNNCIAMENSLYFTINGRIIIGGQVDGLTMETDTMVKNKISIEKHLVYALSIDASLVVDMLSIALEGSVAMRGLAILEYTQRLWDAGKKNDHDKEFWSLSEENNIEMSERRQYLNSDETIMNIYNIDESNSGVVGTFLTSPSIYCKDDDYIFLDMFYQIANIPINHFQTDISQNNHRCVIRCYKTIVDQDTGMPVPHLLYIFRMIMNFCGFIHVITTMDGVKTHHLLYNAALIGMNMAKKVITILVGLKGNNAKSTLARIFEECLWNRVANVSIKSFNDSCGSVSSTQANLSGILGEKMIAVCDEVGYQGNDKYIDHDNYDNSLWDDLKEGTKKQNILECVHLANINNQSPSVINLNNDNSDNTNDTLESLVVSLPSLSPKIIIRSNRKIFLTDIAWWNMKDNTITERLNPRSMVIFCLKNNIVPFSGIVPKLPQTIKHSNIGRKMTETLENPTYISNDNDKTFTYNKMSKQSMLTECLIRNADSVLDYKNSCEVNVSRFLSSLGFDIEQTLIKTIIHILTTPTKNITRETIFEYINLFGENNNNNNNIWEEFNKEKIEQIFDSKGCHNKDNNDYNNMKDYDEDIDANDDNHYQYNQAIDNIFHEVDNKTVKSDYYFDKINNVGYLIKKEQNNEQSTIKEYTNILNINDTLVKRINEETKNIIELSKTSQETKDTTLRKLCSFRSFIVSDGKIILNNTNWWYKNLHLLFNILKEGGTIYNRLRYLEEFHPKCFKTDMDHILRDEDNNTSGVLYCMHAFSPVSDKQKKITSNTINKNLVLKSALEDHKMVLYVNNNPRKGIEEFIANVLLDPSYTNITKIALLSTKAVKLDGDTIDSLFIDIMKLPVTLGETLLECLQNKIKVHKLTLMAIENNNDSDILRKHLKRGMPSTLKCAYPLIGHIKKYRCLNNAINTKKNVDNVDTSKKLLNGQFNCNMIKRVVSTMATVHTRGLFEASREVIATIALFFMSNSYTFQFGLDAAMLKRILFIPCDTVLESSNKNINVSNLVRLIKTGLKYVHKGLIDKRLYKWNRGGGVTTHPSPQSSNIYNDWIQALNDTFQLNIKDHINNNNNKSFSSCELPSRVAQHILKYGVYEISDRQKNAGISTAGNTFFTLYYNILLGRFSPSIYKLKNFLKNDVVTNHTNSVLNNQFDNIITTSNHRHFCSINPKDLKTFSTAIEAARCGSIMRVEKVFKSILFILAPFESSENEHRYGTSISIDGPNITIVRKDGSVDTMLCCAYVPNIDRNLSLYSNEPACISAGSIIFKHLKIAWQSSDITSLQYSCNQLHICFELIYRADNFANRLKSLIGKNREEMIEFMIACNAYKNIIESLGVVDCFISKNNDENIDNNDKTNNYYNDTKRRKQLLIPYGSTLERESMCTKIKDYELMDNTQIFPIVVVNYELSVLLSLTNLSAPKDDKDKLFHFQLVKSVLSNMGLYLNPKYLCNFCKGKQL
uniref:Wsv343-like protein n=1 Tax=Trachysalambria curvirostris majanivirus TaxID=2984281 RepID=A0A9C7BIL8_9VIRU|nr:MAG: wsv343-like protein [Trachysalambria curvirostris majanivirus]